MIEIARILMQSKPGPRRSVVFIAYYGEEKDLLGSRYYAANPLFPIAATVAQINLEQLGRTDDVEKKNVKTLDVTGYDYSEVPEILARAIAPLGVRVLKRKKWSEDAFLRSDNVPLAKLGVPAHTLTVSYMFPDYHGPDDEWQKLDYENMAIVTRAAARGVLTLANRLQVPRWYIGAPFGDKGTHRPIRKPVTRPAALPKASAPESESSPATPQQKPAAPLPPR
jgi:Zn-dependent M28 family amino/carboxypeptidase